MLQERVAPWPELSFGKSGVLKKNGDKNKSTKFEMSKLQNIEQIFLKQYLQTLEITKQH